MKLSPSIINLSIHLQMIQHLVERWKKKSNQINSTLSIAVTLVVGVGVECCFRTEVAKWAGYASSKLIEI